MSPEELIELVKNGPTEKLVAGLAPLTESERKKLSQTAVNLRKELWIPNVSFVRDETRPTVFRLKLALLGVGPQSEVQRVQPLHVANFLHGVDYDRDFVFQVLRDRKPDWIAQWVNKEFEDQDSYPDWRLVQKLIREGVCPKPSSEAYVLKFLLSIFYSDGQKTLREKLLDNPDLLDDEVWRIFELAPAKTTIHMGLDITKVAAAYEPQLAAANSWGHVLRELSREGKIDRQRLLSASLGSLLRNTEARNTVWFCRFHEFIEPTTEERHARQETYLQLLSHPVPAVVELALDALGLVGKGRRLDAPRLLEAIGPVFHLRSKTLPLAAVRLIARESVANNDQAPHLAEVLIAGLAHPAPPVQEEILQLLGKLRGRAAETIAELLPSRLESIAPSLQEHARMLIDATPAESAAPALRMSAPSELIARAKEIPSPWREAAGIDNLLDALESNGELSAVSFDAMAVPRLADNQRVQPVQTLDELIERLTVAVEGLDDPIEFELLVDGLSRLCDERPDDFQARVAPLVLRVEKLVPEHDPFTMTGGGGLKIALFKLILRWCDRDWVLQRSLAAAFQRGPQQEFDRLLEFLNLRLDLVGERISKRVAAPLLACPTHRAGWIDPNEFALRLELYQQQGLEPITHDLVQGLLRLAPDHRADVLARVADMPGKYAPAFRFALGGPLEESSLPVGVLVAAGRARTPFAELGELSSLPDVEGPDALTPAAYAWQVNHADADSQTHWARLYVSVQPGTIRPAMIRDFPTVLVHACRPMSGFASEGKTGMNRWIGTVWPANLDPFFAMGARVHAGHHRQLSLLKQRATFLEPLFDPNVPFSDMAQLHLALCLTEQAAEVTGFAVDALVELVRDGRCVGRELGGVLARMLPSGLIKLNRLGKHLDIVARASLLHTHVCTEIVQDSCLSLTEIPKGLHDLLAPLLQWLSALQRGVDPALRPLLETATSGKTGTLAKKLLSLTSSLQRREQLFLRALEGRVHRAEAWGSAGQLRPVGGGCLTMLTCPGDR
jgi:hypothetical protein